MFLPSETLFAELHAGFPQVVEFAFSARVGIVSPSTAMALLNTIRGVLRDADFRANASLIQVELGRLMNDLSRLDTRVTNLQRHFAQAEKDVQDIGISSGKIMSRAEKIRVVEVDENAESIDKTAKLSAVQSDGG